MQPVLGPRNAQDQGRHRHRDDEKSQALEEAPDEQQADAAGQSAKQARQAAEASAEHDQAAMSEAVDGERDRHATQRGDEVHDRQQPTRLLQVGAEIQQEGGQGWWHLADMGGGDHAGTDQQPDQSPRGS